MSLLNFTPKIGIYSPLLQKELSPGDYVFYTTRDFAHISRVRLDGLPVPSDRIGFAREIIISCNITNSSTLK